MQKLSTQLAYTEPTCQPSNQCRTVWGWHHPLLCLRSSTWVRLHWPCFHWRSWYWYLCCSSVHLVQQLPGMLCIKRKQVTVLCHGLVTEEMLDCIVQLPCFTGCDANSRFYGNDKSSVYDKVAKSPVAQQQLLQYGDSLDLRRRWYRGALWVQKTCDLWWQEE